MFSKCGWIFSQLVITFSIFRNKNEKTKKEKNTILTLEVPGDVVYDATQNCEMDYSKELKPGFSRVKLIDFL